MIKRNKAIDIILKLDIDCILDNYPYQFVKQARLDLVDLRYSILYLLQYVNNDAKPEAIKNIRALIE